MLSVLKGSLLTSLIFLSLISRSAYGTSDAMLNHIANDARWHALLHLQNSKPIITDSFLLSNDQFSPLNELTKTIALFQSSNPKDKTKSCRFIARHYYLNQYFNIELPEIICPEFTHFKKMAPLEDLDLIFASENFSQPSSIMGHTMLAISDHARTRQHSVSFFTEIDEPNPLNLLWSSLYKGKPGYFLVQPLNINIQNYLAKEQRNLWRYTLDLSTQERELVQRHLWELKFPSIPYLFNSHNCATLTFDILTVAKPNIAQFRQNWLSPIDVIKAVNNLQMISKKSLHASAKWKVRLLNQFTEFNPDTDLEESNKALSDIELMLAENYYDYQYEQGRLSATDWQSKHQTLASITNNSDKILSITNAKDPLYTPNDSQFGLSLVDHPDANWGVISWMPASHQLTDDNSQYFSENELKLLQTNIRFNQASLELQSLHLYSVKSLLPSDILLGGISGEFSFGLDRITYNDDTDSLSAYLRGGAGKTYELHSDFKVYGLMEGGVYQSKNHLVFAAGPKIGFIFNQVYKLKSVFYAQQLWRTTQGDLLEFNLKQSLNYWQDFNIVLNANQQILNDQTLEQYKVSFNFYY